MEGTPITLTAQAATDFGFHHWEGDFWGSEPEVDGIESIPLRPEVVFDIHRNAVVGAVFAAYPGASSLDLLGDLEDFIGYAGLSGTVDTLDMNGTDFTPETMLMPNGIPDAPELFLLQSVLQDVGFGIENGVWQPALWYDWTVNLAQAESDLAGIVNPDVRGTVTRVMAALTTLADYGSVAMAEDTVGLGFGITLDATGDTYNMGWRDKLSHKGDVDADGYTNAGEWAAVVLTVQPVSVSGSSSP